MYCHYRQFLDRSRQQLYDWLYPSLAAGVPYLNSGAWPPEELDRVIKYLILDRPELCHFEGRWEYHQGIIPHYTLPSTSCQTLLENANNLLLTCRDPFELYHYLLASISYDLSAPHSQSTWGALMEKRAVCKGIAKAYQLLLQLQDIPCILVEGSLDGINKHVWNLVWKDNHWYPVDITMGFPQFRHLVHGTDSHCGYDFSFSSAAHRVYHPEVLPICLEGGMYHV